jgi:N-acetylmuramoyl-L-alanine amidase
MNIVISSGHGKRIRGASGVLDEVDEARKVTTAVAKMLQSAGVGVKEFHDDTSTTQSQNLKTIVDYHNRQSRDLDVSVHFNAYQTTSKPMGVEVLYVSQQKLAADTAAAISRSGGLINRGAKKRTNLYFLNNTSKPSVLLEVCFVDSTADAELYTKNFTRICTAIAETIGKVKVGDQPPAPPPSGARPVLREGSRGEDVVYLQTTLGIPADGIFGPQTRAVVQNFQRSRGLDPDGVVGPQTWAALDNPNDIPPPPEQPFDQIDIKCSVFGGSKDPNDSAYPPYDKITDKEFGVALPLRFKGIRPQVLIRSRATNYEVMCEIRDIGPWLIDDPYWEEGARPLAETCWKNKTPLPRGPHKGKVPNGAGIDITPAAAKALGLSGMGQVDWRFIDPEEASA